jgi:hypothetical protein
MMRGLPCLCMVMLLAGAAQPVKGKDRAIAGTYDLLICKGSPCSFAERANVLRTAVIVLFDRALNRKDIARIDSTYHDFKYDPVKACFLLVYPNRQTSGVMSWTLSGQTLSFSLVRSPDSWYSVRVERKGDVLSGVGNFWSAGVAPPPGFIPDTVVGRRRGPADLSACTMAGNLH